MFNIKDYLTFFEAKQKIIQVILVANVDSITTNYIDYTGHSLKSEYLSEIELEMIKKSFNKMNIKTLIYYDEEDFIKDFVNNNKASNSEKINIVINMSQKGKKIGRKSLIPAFCDLYNIIYTSSNPYCVSLCRNKYHSGLILAKHNIKTPQSWIYSKSGWLLDGKPSEGMKIIIKLNNESSSIGIDRNSIIIYKAEKDYIIREVYLKYQQELIIQEFVEGYEIECPVISDKQVIPLIPMGIEISNIKNLKDEILTYDIRNTEEYNFYDFQKFNPKLSENIMEITKNSATILGITGFGRIDFRVNNNDLYITDIATNPHIVEHSSFFNSFRNLGYNYEQMLGTLLGLALSKNYDSDQN